MSSSHITAPLSNSDSNNSKSIPKFERETYQIKITTDTDSIIDTSNDNKVKSDLEKRNFDTSILSDNDISFLDQFAHQCRSWSYTMEMHDQIWSSISFYILNRNNPEIQYKHLLDLLENYDWVEIKNSLLKDNSINLSIKFVKQNK